MSWDHSLGWTQLVAGLRKGTVTARAPLSHSLGPYQPSCPISLPHPSSEGSRGCNLGTALPPCPNAQPQLSAFTLCPAALVPTLIPGESPFLFTVCLPRIPPAWLTPTRPSSWGWAVNQPRRGDRAAPAPLCTDVDELCCSFPSACSCRPIPKEGFAAWISFPLCQPSPASPGHTGSQPWHPQHLPCQALPLQRG